VGEELSIPVYLYEEAATRPERKNLENIRKGEYEALKTEIAASPEREPDFGPARLGPAGATVIGARHPLIAFNVYLTTDDVTVAKKIARAIRHSSGGLRYVKALGLLVEGRAQVSMNLTNYAETPVARVVEMIRSEAARYGVAIHHSELVGLIPEDALIEAATWYLQLDQFEPHQVLERRLFDLMKGGPEADKSMSESPPLPGLTSQDFLAVLAAGTPTPGGGSASAYCGATGAALVEMVAHLTVDKPKYAALKQDMEDALDRAAELREELTRAVASDAAAFDGVMAAYRMPKGTPEEGMERTRAIQQATLKATHVPLDVASMAVSVMELALRMAEQGNINAMSDAGVAFYLGQASLAGAGLNVRMNLVSIQDPQVKEEIQAKLRGFEDQAVSLENRLCTSLQERGGLQLE
jgi:glutamate formiminotransferase/formiminotetrahydrofolate cyclodeaminase